MTISINVHLNDAAQVDAIQDVSYCAVSIRKSGAYEVTMFVPREHVDELARALTKCCAPVTRSVPASELHAIAAALEPSQ